MSDWRTDIKMTRAEELAQELFRANRRIAELEALLERRKSEYQDMQRRMLEAQAQQQRLVEALVYIRKAALYTSAEELRRHVIDTLASMEKDDG